MKSEDDSPLRAAPAVSSLGVPSSGALTAVVQNLDRFLGFVRQRIGDPALAEDVLQDALEKAATHQIDLEDEGKVDAWFYRILRNAVIDAYRRRDARGRALDRLELEPTVDFEAFVAVCACVKGQLTTLKTEYREILEALDFGDETPASYAIRQDLSAANVKVRRHRARKALRQSLLATCVACAPRGCLDGSC